MRQYIDLMTLALAVADLNAKRFPKLAAVAKGTATIYGPLLLAKQSELDAHLERPQADTARPLADQLTEAAARYDELGRYVFGRLSRLIDEPDTSAEDRTVAVRVRRALFTQHPGRRVSYARRAGITRQLRKRVAERAADLAHLTMANGAPMRDPVDAWMAEGARIGRLLSERTDLELPQEDGEAAIALRSTTLGLIGRARAALADERAGNPAIPARLDAAVFGHFDSLAGAAVRDTARPSANDEPASPDDDGV